MGLDEQITVRKSDVVNAFIMCLLEDPDDLVEDVHEEALGAADHFFEILRKVVV